MSKTDLMCDRSQCDDNGGAAVFSICGNMDNKTSDISVDYKLGHKICNNSSNLNEMNGNTNANNNGSNSKTFSKTSIRNGREQHQQQTCNGNATKSVGTQYSSIKRNTNRNNVKSEKIQDGDIVVISNEFRDNAVNQQCLIDSKRKILKLLKSRQNIDWRSLDDMRPTDATSMMTTTNNNGSPENGSLTNGTAKTVLSKSDSLVASVELVFIPDECLQETPKKVYILKDTAPGLSSKILSKIHQQNGDAERKEIFFISDDFRKNSLKNSTVIVDDDVPKRRNKPLKYLKHSVQQSSVDDVNNKMVSQAFHSYDEEDDNLEKKELKNGNCPK